MSISQTTARFAIGSSGKRVMARLKSGMASDGSVLRVATILPKVNRPLADEVGSSAQLSRTDFRVEIASFSRPEPSNALARARREGQRREGSVVAARKISERWRARG
jgi:hypothetical protein